MIYHYAIETTRMSINDLKMIKQKIILFLVICFFLSACTGIKSNNGYMPVKDNVDQLKVNVTTTSSAKNLLGEPALILGNREPIFVYSAQITDRVLFFEPKVISRDVLVLYFNKKKKLKNLDKFDLNDGKHFDLSAGNTNLKDTERSFLSSLFSNVGISGVRAID
jgi:outer membrane protein assembly factor BamE (lipoprotein component of BamABCDE complex)